LWGLTGELLVERMIRECKKCRVTGKPFIEHRVYKQFLPSRVRVLVVSESPPPGAKEDYLYNLACRDRLRVALGKAFNVNEKKVPATLMEKRVFWTTAVKCRPPSRKHIEAMRRNCLSILEKEIRELRPQKIVALGTTAWRSISELGIKEIPVVRGYHPLYTIRFRRQELSKLKDLILDP